MPRTLSQSGGSLPVGLSSFVGRREELGEVQRLLGGARLVTLIGVGGTGKTRLAMHAATALRRGFPHGVWFVDSTGLRAPEKAAQTRVSDGLAYLVMIVLGLREQPGAGS